MLQNCLKDVTCPKIGGQNHNFLKVKGSKIHSRLTIYNYEINDHFITKLEFEHHFWTLKFTRLNSLVCGDKMLNKLE